MDGPDVELSVPNRFFRDWLTEHYMGIIKESMSSVAGIPLNLRLIIDKSPLQGKKIVEAPVPVSCSQPEWQGGTAAKISPVV